MMDARALFYIPALTLFTAVFAPAPAWTQSSAPETRSERQSKAATVTGVVDQREGKFVIAGADQVEPIAVLHGKGFSDDNFARFVGMRVTVKGDMVTEEDEKVLYVRNLADIRQVEDEQRSRQK